MLFTAHRLLLTCTCLFFDQALPRNSRPGSHTVVRSPDRSIQRCAGRGIFPRHVYSRSLRATAFLAEAVCSAAKFLSNTAKLAITNEFMLGMGRYPLRSSSAEGAVSFIASCASLGSTCCSLVLLICFGNKVSLGTDLERQSLRRLRASVIVRSEDGWPDPSQRHISIESAITSSRSEMRPQFVFDFLSSLAARLASLQRVASAAAFCRSGVRLKVFLAALAKEVAGSLPFGARFFARVFV